MFLATIDLLVIFFMSCLTFALFAFDKHQAHFQFSRIPEALLLIPAFLGGAFGGLCGMLFFRHKTKKTLFMVSIPLLVFLQLGGIVLLRTILYSLLPIH